jgi:hypothetical protein
MIFRKKRKSHFSPNYMFPLYEAGSYHVGTVSNTPPKLEHILDALKLLWRCSLSARFDTDQTHSKKYVLTVSRCYISDKWMKSKGIPNENSNYPWWKYFKKTSTFMAAQRIRLPEGQTPRRVKVAILDTGYNKNDPDFREARDCLPDDAVVEFEDFVGESKIPIDRSGHGTRVAYLLLKITQNVDLWIARVFEKTVGTTDSAGRVRMVRYEAANWNQYL